jgi:hypothetical protein
MNREEDAMRAFIVLGMAVVLSGVHLYAQPFPAGTGGERSTLGRLQSYQDCNMQKLEGRLRNSLSHDVEGVVVGALREVAKIKLAQPACTSDRIVRHVEDLVHDGATPAIRYKAYLTSIVLSTPHSFVEEGMAEFQTDEQFFTALARRLESLALRDER